MDKEQTRTDKEQTENEQETDKEWTKKLISTLKWPANTVISVDETGGMKIYCPDLD